jgi:hypothetical protein
MHFERNLGLVVVVVGLDVDYQDMHFERNLRLIVG